MSLVDDAIRAHHAKVGADADQREQEVRERQARLETETRSVVRAALGVEPPTIHTDKNGTMAAFTYEGILFDYRPHSSGLMIRGCERPIRSLVDLGQVLTEWQTRIDDASTAADVPRPWIPSVAEQPELANVLSGIEMHGIEYRRRVSFD